MVGPLDLTVVALETIGLCWPPTPPNAFNNAVVKTSDPFHSHFRLPRSSHPSDPRRLGAVLRVTTLAQDFSLTHRHTSVLRANSPPGQYDWHTAYHKPSPPGPVRSHASNLYVARSTIIQRLPLACFVQWWPWPDWLHVDRLVNCKESPRETASAFAG